MPKLLEFGCHLLTFLHDVPELLRYGLLLEKYGFDHLKVGDHTLTMNKKVQYPNAHTILTAIGVSTKRIRLSTAVTDPYRRHPVEIAQATATLDHVTNGRTVLGIGAGEVMNLEPFGIEWEKPVTHLKEAVEVIKLLWMADPSNPAQYSGRIFNLRDAYLQIKPLQKPHPKIYIGAVGPTTRRLAGMIGDGWAAAATESPTSLKEHIKEVCEGAEKVGRGLDELDIVATLYTDVSDDYERAYRSVEAVAKAMLIQERNTLKLLGHNIEIPDEITLQRIRVDRDQDMERVSKMAETIPRSIVESTVAIGTADQCISKIEAFLKAGATSIAICNLGPEPDRIYRIYSERIIPYLKEQYTTQ